MVDWIHHMDSFQKQSLAYAKLMNFANPEMYVVKLEEAYKLPSKAYESERRLDRDHYLLKIRFGSL